MKKKNDLKFTISLVSIIVLLLMVVVVIFSTFGRKTNSENTGTVEQTNNANLITFTGQTITNGGTYLINGDSGAIEINTNQEVILELMDANISGDNGPAINIVEAKEVIINISGTNKVVSNTTTELDGAIYSKADLVFKGDGSLSVSSNLDGIVSKDDLVIEGGIFNIEAQDDGIRGKDCVIIEDGTFIIDALKDGIKSTNAEDNTKGYVEINGGKFNVNCGNDGIQAETDLTINGGEFTINTNGSLTNDSDSSKALKAVNLITINKGIFNIDAVDDAFHSNNDIVINGGEFVIETDDDAFHSDNTLTINDGSINIKSCYEGFEGSTVYINGGNNIINAGDDGVNAASSDSSGSSNSPFGGRDFFSNSTGILEINGGITKVYAEGDGLDSNGTITINGGEVYVECFNNGPEEAIDHIGGLVINGGTIITLANNVAFDDGTKTSNIPYFNETVNTSGDIKIDSISYSPTISSYRYLFIASDKLQTGTSILVCGSSSIDVTITTGTFSSNGGFSGQQFGPGGKGPGGRGR